MITQTQFDTIYRGLAAQGWERSYDEEHTMCLYRDRPNGRKCAIGHLIADEDYTVDMDAFDTSSGCFTLVNFHQRDLLMDMTSDEFQLLQQAHDNNEYPAEMKAAFEDIALDLGLVIPS
ncbi:MULTISPECIES: hypothetical protein [unclassified Mesorhizobium]|uniref:hypothetical protein n=1 Tax=unclassified Mesorhizobium TaxID=325217 RepID=UPI00112E8EA4|nr:MULTISPECIES: hypothetical protein [unclassified Mesorhizobium]TPJ51751.1 hypothetical protein FJ426_18770 [Mesorhizobium sp. B2-6-4]TPN42373.1 hypothetical protein FJ979_02185 [Mesorhizobium sp. B1-1-6]